jgi:hypothetical protein
MMEKGKKLATILVFTVFGVCILCGCVDNEVETPVSTPSSTPTLTETLHPTTLTPSVTQEEKNIQIVTEIVEEYYKTHTYSEYDLFVCADMAIEVWNMVETQGINAEIAVGNVDNPNADWKEYNHAWVLAEVSPDTWLALEATGGYVTYDKKYYSGYFFTNPKEFKRYLELMKEYNAQIDRINGLQIEYSDTYNEWVREVNYYNVLSNEYNNNCAGTRSLTPVEYQDCLNLLGRVNAQRVVVERISGRADQLVYTINEENQRLTEIINALNELLT